MDPTPRGPDEDSSVAPPSSGAALVVARWNAWVRVWLPSSGETRWVNLREVGFQPGSAARSGAGEEG